MPDELNSCLDKQLDAFLSKGDCIQTIYWGDVYAQHLKGGNQMLANGRLGMAPIPGSPRVYNRDSDALETCTNETCPHGVLSRNGTFLINRPSYAAFGGWVGGVSNMIEDEEKTIMADFFDFASSRDWSKQFVIANATGSTFYGTDPFRQTQLEVDEWTAMGYDFESATRYLDLVQSDLNAPNIIQELRIPFSELFVQILDENIHQHLTRSQDLIEEGRFILRQKTVSNITKEYQSLVSEFDSSSSGITLLELYQMSRGLINGTTDPDDGTMDPPMSEASSSHSLFSSISNGDGGGSWTALPNAAAVVLLGWLFSSLM